MKYLKILVHLLVVVFLTILTQIGGILWVLCFSIFSVRKTKFSKSKKIGIFIIVYLISSLLLVPFFAKFSGRTALPISNQSNLVPHNYFTILCNRHYVTPSLKVDLMAISNNFQKKQPKVNLPKISYQVA